LPPSVLHAYDRRSMRILVSLGVLVTSMAVARGGTLVGKLDLPQTPSSAPPATRGFLDRKENPFAPVRAIDVAHQVVIVVEGEEKPVSPPQVMWDLVGESFAHPVVAAPAGAEVIIRNSSKTPRTLAVQENPKLIDPGPLNPTATKSFRATDVGKVYTIADKDAPHLVGRVIVVNTQFVAYPDESGHFQIDNIPPGAYKLKIWYRDNWLQRPDEDVNVSAKGKTEINPKVAAAAFAGKPEK
jgi:Polysaccharide lyase family 4, domain II